MDRAQLMFKGFPNIWKFNGIDDTIKFIYNFLWPMLGIVAAAVIYSGIRYIMAGGDASAAAAAKKNLIWTLTGLVLIISALAIIHWIPQGLGGTL